MATTYRRKPTKAEVRRQKMEELVMFPIDWLEERSGLIGGLKYFLFRNVPSDINWMQTLGSAALTAFLVQAISGETLTRFYSLHMLLIPGLIIGLITLHLYLVVRLGVTSPPWSKEAAGGEPEEEDGARLRPGLTRPVPRPSGASAMQAEPGGRE